jgi:phosphoglycerate dehydrogenase-like enzyme
VIDSRPIDIPRPARSLRTTVVVPDDVVGVIAASAETARLRAIADVEVHGSRPDSEAVLAARIREADAVLSFRPAFTRFPAAVLRQASQLRLLCISGTGVEEVDVREATARGIAVANVVGSANRAVAEHCLALAFAVARRVCEQDQAIRGGTWQALEGIELGGKTLGVVGISGISRELIPLATGLGMRVLSYSRDNDPERARRAGATATPLDELLAASDVVSLHVRLSPATTGLIGARELALMKPGAILVNTARGPVVDEDALIQALASGRLRGAGLDVFSTEPLPAGHRLASLPSVVMSPVAGWNTVDASERMMRQAVDNVVGFLLGRPVNVVNPEALARPTAQEESP